MKPAVAVYVRHFLPASMTFVYRQLKGVEDSFAPVVLAAQRHHLDRFPFEPVHLQPVGLLEKVGRYARYRVFGRFGHVAARRLRGWADACRQHGVRLIHAHFGNRALEILPLARMLDVPLLVTFHGQDASSWPRDSAYRRGLKDLFAYADVLAVSQTMADRLVEFGADPARLNVHRVGIPLDAFAFTERTPVRDKTDIAWLQVSNFVEKKGHRYTVAAFRKVLEASPGSRLTLAGDGPLRAEIKEACRDLGDRVRFPGKVAPDQVADLVRNADVFVHHSVTAASGEQEGIPTAVMEAMASGLPVISTVHAGIPELIEDGVSGHLVAERDVETYADKMRLVLGDDGSLGRRAAQTVRESYALNTQNQLLKQHYARLLQA